MATNTLKITCVYHILDDRFYTFESLEELQLSILFIKHQPK
jgi:hypothetical protein